MVDVVLGNQTIQDEQDVSRATCQECMNLGWDATKHPLHTVYVHDENGPPVFNNYLVVNVPGNDLSQGHTWIDYMAPNPPRGELHKYNVEVRGQHDYIDYNNEDISRTGNKFDFSGYPLVGKSSFIVGEQTMTSPGKFGGGDRDMHVSHGSQPVNMISTVPSIGAPLNVGNPGHYLANSSSSSSKSSSSNISSSGVAKSSYFKTGSTLSDAEQRYCRCVLHVKAKGGAYNPYAVCAKSVGTTSRQCGASYDYKNIPGNELQAYAEDKDIPIPQPYSKEAMVRNINAWKASKGKK